MASEGSLRSIKVARKKKKDFEAEVREGLKSASEQIQRINEHLAKIFSTLKEVVNANNAASLITASVERFLDGKHPGWDDGIRDDILRRRNLLAERKALHAEAVAQMKPDAEIPCSPQTVLFRSERRVELADRLWEVGKELGTEVQDGAISVSLLLKSKLPERADARIKELRGMTRETTPEISPEGRNKELRGTTPEISPELEVIFKKLEERVAEVRRSERRPVVPGE